MRCRRALVGGATALLVTLAGATMAEPAGLRLGAAVSLRPALDEIVGLRLWMEFGLGLVNSAHQAVLGVSYPLGSPKA